MLDLDPTFQQIRKIQVFDTFRESFGLAWSPAALRMPMLWLPVVLRLAMMWMATRLFADFPDMEHFDPKTDSLQPFFDSISLPQCLAVAAIGVLYSASILALMLSWLRFLIIGETPSGAYFGPGFWIYLGRTLLVDLGLAGIMLATTIPLVILAAFLTGRDGAGASLALTIIMVAVVVVFATWLAAAVMPYLIAGGIGHTQLSFRSSLRIMKGNIWRYIGGGLLIGVSFIVPGTCAGLVASSLPEGEWRQLADAVLQTPIMIFEWIVSATYMALVYRQLVPAKPERRVFDV